MKHKLKLQCHVLDPFHKVLDARKEEHLAGNALRIPLQEFWFSDAARNKDRGPSHAAKKREIATGTEPPVCQLALVAFLRALE
jgi:hypothetical protein